MRQFSSLRKNQEFSTLYKKGRKWHCEGVLVIFLQSKEQKMAVVASKKIGKAVQRNRAKRLLRVVFSKVNKDLSCGYYVLIAKEGILQLDYARIEKNVKWALRRLQCLSA